MKANEFIKVLKKLKGSDVNIVLLGEEYCIMPNESSSVKIFKQKGKKIIK